MMNNPSSAVALKPRAVTLELTKKVEALLEARGAFPELRSASAERVFSGFSRHVVPLETARALLDFLGTVAAQRDLPRGLPWAVASMRDNIRRALDWEQEGHARNSESTPAIEAVRAGLLEGSALLRVGDRVRLPGGQGLDVEVTHPFDLYACPDPKGAHVCQVTGMRVSYRPGYLVCPVGVEGAALFIRAGSVVWSSGERTHLKRIDCATPKGQAA